MNIYIYIFFINNFDNHTNLLVQEAGMDTNFIAQTIALKLAAMMVLQLC